jgi:tRNA-dihydrouridine synthase
LAHAPFVDFNCGCPSPTVVGNGAGSGLLETVDLFDAYVGGLAHTLGANRFSIKMRTGYARPEEFPFLLEVIARHGPRRLTVHGRTRVQRYLGHADWSLIAQAARLPGPTEVVGSGDILGAASFLARKGEFGEGPCIVGRGALRNPFVFDELAGGQEIALGREALLLSLDVYQLLQHLSETSPHGLLDLVGGSGAFRSACRTAPEAWRALRALLARSAGFNPEEPAEWPIERGSFFKVKMLWNYWRSGLPEGFFVPGPLRTSTYGDFRANVAALAAESDPALVMSHRTEHDWVYSGGKERA